MSITINGATNTLTAASGLTIAGNTAVTGTLSSTGILNVGTNKCRVSPTGAALQGILAGVQIDSYDDNLSLFASPATPGTNTFQICGYTPDSGGWLSMLETSHVASGYPTVKIGQGASGFVGTFSSTGLAVTGTLSATDKLTVTSPATGQAIELRNRALDDVYSGIYFKTNDGVTEQTAIQNERVGTNGARFLFYTKADGGALTNNCILSSTGLAVTGLLDLSAASSGQIKFPATQNASSDANTLDDYEEGTFTPTYYGSGTAGTTTYTTQTGSYVKIGKAVHFTLQVTWTAATGTGAAKVGGLPFTAANEYTVVPVASYDLSVTASNYVAARLGYGAVIDILELAVGSTGAGSTNAVDAGGATINISGTYFV